MKMFDWLTKHARVIQIGASSLSQDYVQFSNPVDFKDLEGQDGNVDSSCPEEWDTTAAGSISAGEDSTAAVSHGAGDGIGCWFH